MLLVTPMTECIETPRSHILAAHTPPSLLRSTLFTTLQPSTGKTWVTSTVDWRRRTRVPQRPKRRISDLRILPEERLSQRGNPRPIPADSTNPRLPMGKRVAPEFMDFTDSGYIL